MDNLYCDLCEDVWLVVNTDLLKQSKDNIIKLSKTLDYVNLLSIEEYVLYNSKSEYDRKLKKNYIIKGLTSQDSLCETETVGSVNEYLNKVKLKL